jgi:Glycosyltransferase family 9 (heptosyltransferase)
MDVLVDYQGPWGLGDLLCSDPLILGLAERHGPDARIFLRGRVGNVIHNPRVAGMAPDGLRPDVVVPVRLFSHMDAEEYGRLEALPSLIDHMCSYGGVTPSDKRPQLHLTADDFAVLREVALPPRRPRIVMCVDHVDPLRHWPVDRWRTVAAMLQQAGAVVVGVGVQDHLGLGIDLVGRLSVRQTAAVLTQCDLFLGNNSGLFHYAQAALLPCVTLFSLALPQRFVHPGAVVYPVEAAGLPCLHCMTRCFAAMQKSGCIAAPRGRCMTDIALEQVLDAVARALEDLQARKGARKRSLSPA